MRLLSPEIGYFLFNYTSMHHNDIVDVDALSSLERER